MVGLYQGVPGTRLEPVGGLWAAYSPASGETHLLNAESAAILEWLHEHGPGSSEAIAQELAAEVELPLETVLAGVELSWDPLLLAGLVRPATASGAP